VKQFQLLLYTFLILAFSTSFCCAQDQLGTTNWKPIKSISATYEIVTSFEREKTISRVIYKSDYKRYFYDINIVLFDSEPYRVIAAYDGSKHYLYDASRQHLTISSTDKYKREPVFALYNFIYMAYSHIPSHKLDDTWVITGLSDMTAQPASTVDPIELPSQTSEFRVFRYNSFADVIHPKQPCFLDIVFFNKHAGYPMQWEKHSDDRVFSKYKVLLLETITTDNSCIFYYPKVSSLQMYGLDGKPGQEMIATIESLAINTQLNDEDFLVDPSKALIIFDTDNGTQIRVPAE